MIIKILNKDINIDSKKKFIMVIAYLNRKIELIYEKGEDHRAQPFLDMLLAVELEYNKFKGVHNFQNKTRQF